MSKEQIEPFSGEPIELTVYLKKVLPKICGLINICWIFFNGDKQSNAKQVMRLANMERKYTLNRTG